MRAMEYLQLDPLQIIARNQDITLHSRVLDYTPGLWEELAYRQRKFFDWGGWLAVRPMDELSHWRVPQAWTPLEATTTEEVVFLAPLDPCAVYFEYPFLNKQRGEGK